MYSREKNTTYQTIQCTFCKLKTLAKAHTYMAAIVIMYVINFIIFVAFVLCNRVLKLNGVA